MQDFMFATLLFLVYFCFACYLVHNPKAEATTSNPVPVVIAANPTVTLQVQTVAPEPTVIEVAAAPQESSQDEELKADIWEASAVEESAVEELEDVPVDRNQAESAISAESVLNPQPELYIQVLAVLDNLGKRETRKVMGGLKLQQKRNGVELSTELMVASVRLQFKADPERVIEVIRSRLLNRLPAVTDQQLAS